MQIAFTGQEVEENPVGQVAGGSGQTQVGQEVGPGIGLQLSLQILDGLPGEVEARMHVHQLPLDRRQVIHRVLDRLCCHECLRC